MIHARIINIESENDYDQLYSYIPSTHVDCSTIEELKCYIGNRADRIIIEYPYADRDFLSTYYIFYSKKFRSYEKSCYRIHFFDKLMYYGFVTLRPTISGTRIGRSYIEPSLLVSGKAYVMWGAYKVNLLGNEIFVNAFPWMHQETDISVCAHASVWSIVRYFGNKYRYYPDWTMGQIVTHIKNARGRKIPSTGLSALQICEVLQDAGFSPIIRESKNNYFLDEILSYVESGIPVIGMSSSSAHAFSIIGHGETDMSIFSDDSRLSHICETYKHNGKKFETDVILSSKCIKTLIVNDDNVFPYRTIPLTISDMIGTDAQYCAANIDAVVVPLYDKMQIVFNEVYNRFLILNESQQCDRKSAMHWPTPKVARIFITSSNSFKEKCIVPDHEHPMPKDIRNLILRMNFPKFIWCIEIYKVSDYSDGIVSGMIIIDTTACSSDSDPWLFMHDSRRIKWINERGKVDIMDMSDEFIPYKRYINNLNEVN